MKKRFISIIAIFIALTLNFSHAQDETGSYYIIPQGFHLDLGFYNTIPTSSVIFPSWRADNTGVIRETLSNEWDVPRRLGGYVEMSTNIGWDRPIFLGGAFKFQNLYRFREKRFEDPIVNNISYQTYQWTYQNKAYLFNYSFFTEYSIWYKHDFSFFARGELGVSHYNHRAFVDWRRMDWESDDNQRVMLQKNNALSFSGDLGLGCRWQFGTKLALKAHVGYQLQTANRFPRYKFISDLEVDLEVNKPLPNDGDFSLIQNDDVNRPIKLQYEHLYAQIGISMRLDGEMMAEKPVLYLYPEDTLDVNVELVLNNQAFAFSYPKYKEGGWNVKAAPDGTLFDYESQRNYYTLFWETKGEAIAENLSEGFVVQGDESAAFLEQKLMELGLNYKEANEFIIYWLPQLEQNKYNAIYFAFDEYEASSELHITPKPETIIRIMMLWEPLEDEIELQPQILPKTPERKGFTAVEWGGTKGKFFKSKATSL
jgi:hypothetical protein